MPDSDDDDASFSHKQYYVPVLEASESSGHILSQRSMPILADSQRSFRYEWDDAETGIATGMATTHLNGMSMGDLQDGEWTPWLQRLKRKCVALRWQLSRRLFGVPLPLFTSHFELKLGDMLLTFPVITVLIAHAMRLALQRNVLASGAPPTIGLLLVFLLVVRNNSIQLALLGLSFERALFYHKLFAGVTVILAGLHGMAYLLARQHGELPHQRTKATTGLVAFVAMVAMLLLSTGFIRRRFFDFFVRAHWLLFIFVLVYAVIHGATLALLGIIPWALDMLFRLAYRVPVYAQGSAFNGHRGLKTGRKGVIERNQVTIVKLASDIVHIQFPRVRADTNESFRYRTGQYVFLCIPAFSTLEWHPFTISSSPDEDAVTFHIKAIGDWTRKVLDIAPKDGLEGKLPMEILVDGPYGGLSIDIYNPAIYSHFVLLSGGIGVTPMRSITTWLHHECYNRKRDAIQRVKFVWVVRDRENLKALIAEEATEKVSDEFFIAESPRKPQSPSFRDSVTDKFSFDFYVTQSEPDAEAPVARDVDKRLKYGARPEIGQILREMGNEAKQCGKIRVAVLVCGPKEMMRETIATSVRLSLEMKLHFDVHSERFGF
ncbi:hypothetical protein BBJ28_00007815 [Nothophytophthora sp. Chile5]|nr:hypothetical protein BBJ28_00007815 [Nothophytophthora sp. Chile5]